MFRNNHPVASPESTTAQPVDLIETPELWTPPRFETNYADAHAEAIRSPTRIPEHFESYAAAHVREAIIALEFGNVTPGTIPKPDSGLKRHAVETLGASRSGLREMLASRYGAEASTQEQDEAYAEDQERSRALKNRVQSVLTAVSTAPTREVRLHLHLLTLDILENTARRQTEQDADDRRRVSMLECPICLESDHERIGRVELRALLPGQVLAAFPAPNSVLRSCLACWHVASQEHVARLRDAATSADDRRSRRDLVLDHLASR